MLVYLNGNIKPLLITMEHTKYLVEHKVGQQLNSTPQNFSLSTLFIKVNFNVSQNNITLYCEQKIKINFEFKSNQ